MDGWQRALVNQVGSAGGSGGMHDAVGLAAAADPQFVMLRDNTRDKIFQFLQMLPLLPPWRPRLRALASRLEEILFRKYPSKMEYYNMRRRPMPPAMIFAIKTFTARNRQYQQSSRQIASSPGYGAMNLTSSIMQGASENSGPPNATGNIDHLSSSADMVLQNANMDSSLAGTDRFTEIVLIHILGCGLAGGRVVGCGGDDCIVEEMSASRRRRSRELGAADGRLHTAGRTDNTSRSSGGRSGAPRHPLLARKMNGWQRTLADESGRV